MSGRCSCWVVVVIVMLTSQAHATNVVLSGPVSVVPNGSGTTVTMYADEIANLSPYYRSGTLRLEYWAFAYPFDGGTQLGYELAVASLGQLNAGYSYFDVSEIAYYDPPPYGFYYPSLMLTEYGISGYKAVDWVNFSGRYMGVAPDSDGDGWLDVFDNCMLTYNPNQGDGDGDDFGDVCDICPVDSTNDADDDGICGRSDNCPANSNSTQLDRDGDRIGDVCDSCKADSLNDADRDGLCADSDNCPSYSNANQYDEDQDGAGDACDASTTFARYQSYLAANVDLLSAGICDESSAFAHWRDWGRSTGRRFDGGSAPKAPNGSIDSSYAIDGGFTWRYANGRTVVFIASDGRRPSGWAGSDPLLSRCSTFDLGSGYSPSEYSAVNPGLAEAVAAIPNFASMTDHYVKYGFKSGLVPNAAWTIDEYYAWDDDAYLAANPDVAAFFEQAAESGWIIADKPGFAHWVAFGRDAGRASGQIPAELVQEFEASGGYRAYLAANVDLLEAGVCNEASAFDHWRNWGRDEDRLFDDGATPTISGGEVDRSYAIEGGFTWRYGDGRTRVFVTADAAKPSGWAGSDPLLARCGFFDLGSAYTPSGYDAANPGLATAVASIPSFASLTDHYVKYGFKSGLVTSIDWDPGEYFSWSDAAYFAANPDVEAFFEQAMAAGWPVATKPGFAHWINFGREAGRDPGQ